MGEFFKMLLTVFTEFLNMYFDITVLGINFGALFLIGVVVSFAAWLIWG